MLLQQFWRVLLAVDGPKQQCVARMGPYGGVHTCGGAAVMAGNGSTCRRGHRSSNTNRPGVYECCAILVTQTGSTSGGVRTRWTAQRGTDVVQSEAGSPHSGGDEKHCRGNRRSRFATHRVKMPDQPNPELPSQGLGMRNAVLWNPPDLGNRIAPPMIRTPLALCYDSAEGKAWQRWQGN